jgi:hydroxyethylthiazole kinase-like sugar kinase family protein
MRSSPLTPRLVRNVCSFRRSPTLSLNFVANVLLSAGASPAMADNPEEAGLFAGVADGVAPDPLTEGLSQRMFTCLSRQRELAEAVASRLGSFAAALVDALDAVDETSLRSRAKIQPAVLIQ